jgi:N4-gp56 family major capsid protein
MKPAIEDIKNDAGESKFVEVQQYADKTKFVHEGEFGAVGRFRFIAVYTMPVFEGEGADVVGDNVEDLHVHGNKYNVYPMLFVGSDSFKIMNLSGETASVISALPKADANIDNFGKKGSIAVSWYFTLVPTHPERIRTLYTCTKRG